VVHIGNAHDRNQADEFRRPNEIHHRLRVERPVLRVDDDEIQARIAQTFDEGLIAQADKGPDSPFPGLEQVPQAIQ